MKKPERYRTESENDSYSETRRQALRKVKREHNIPVSSQPGEVIKPNTPKGDKLELDNRNRRLYIFRLISFLFGNTETKEVHIREDKGVIYPENIGNQIDHFNVGEGTPPDKLRKHYYFKRKNK